jgi:hypothetical protein
MEERGEEPFNGYQLPQAALALKLHLQFRLQ